MPVLNSERTSLAEKAPATQLWSLLALAVCVIGAFVLGVRDYGPGYDELIGDFQYGERTLLFFLTGQREYLELHRPPPIRQPGFLVEGHRDLASTQLEAPHVHGHGAALVSAMTCGLLFRTLGWLPAVEAHHFANLLFGLALVLVMFGQLRGLLGPPAAWLAVLFWLAQPRLVAHGFFNIKDFPEACLFGLTVLVFWVGWNRLWGSPGASSDGRRAHGRPTAACVAILGVAAALWGWALSVKINAVFVPLILIPWTWITRDRSRAFFAGNRARCWVRGFLIGTLLIAIAAAAFFLSWPYLWLRPDELLRHVQFVFMRGHTGQWDFHLAPLGEWLTATPELILASSVIGIVLAIRESDPRRRSFLCLVLLWYAVPLVRANLPGMRHYDGIRHFLEVTVPAAILAGYAVGRVVDWLAARVRSRLARGVVIFASMMAIFAVAIWPFVGLHPYELAYFNRISGGLKGAHERGHPDAGDYWAASYRQGVRWMNRNLPAHSVLAVPFAEHLVALTRGSPDGLRPDIELLHVAGPFELEAGRVYVEGYYRALREGAVYVMFVTRQSWENEIIRHAREYGEPVFPDGKVNGVPVLNIYKVDSRRAEPGRTS